MFVSLLLYTKYCCYNHGDMYHAWYYLCCASYSKTASNWSCTLLIDYRIRRLQPNYYPGTKFTSMIRIISPWYYESCTAFASRWRICTAGLNDMCYPSIASRFLVLLLYYHGAVYDGVYHISLGRFFMLDIYIAVGLVSVPKGGRWKHFAESFHEDVCLARC